METEIQMDLPAKLTSLRKKNGLTQLDLAEKLGVSRQAVSRWEVGSAVPTIDNLKALSSLYSVSVDYLLRDGTEEPCAKAEGPRQSPPEQEAILRRATGKTGLIFILFLTIAIAIMLCAALLHGQKRNRVTPIKEMDSVVEDGYPAGTFSLK